MTSLIPPYGGVLIDLFEPTASLPELLTTAAALPSVQLSERSRCDLELLATGGFSPLDRFLGRADYERLVAEMRLANGTLFPIPITLPIADDAPVAIGKDVVLRSPHAEILAVMTVEEIYEWDRDEAAINVFGTRDTKHPLVAEMAGWGRRNISGPLRVISSGTPWDFRDLRRTPAEVRQALEAFGHDNVVAFQTRNPMHRAHEELVRRAIDAVDDVLLLHPSVGMTKPGDVDHYTRVRTYRVLAEKHFPPGRVLLSLAMRTENAERRRGMERWRPAGWLGGVSPPRERGCKFRHEKPHRAQARDACGPAGEDCTYRRHGGQVAGDMVDTFTDG
jgi:sulfate adenylyltransferase